MAPRNNLFMDQNWLESRIFIIICYDQAEERGNYYILLYKV
jgi:hypothetical protein